MAEMQCFIWRGPPDSINPIAQELPGDDEAIDTGGSITNGRHPPEQLLKEFADDSGPCSQNILHGSWFPGAPKIFRIETFSVTKTFLIRKNRSVVPVHLRRLEVPGRRRKPH